MGLYNEQFSNDYDFPIVDRPAKILVIASTSRCGSHMLGHSLYETNSFGFPLEYANPANLAEWKRRLGTETLADSLLQLKHRRTSPNGVFSIKVHYSHISQFGNFKRMVELLPDAYYVLLRRKNVLMQAISYSIAAQTGVWIKGQQGNNRTPVYDFADIEGRLREIINDHSSWRYTLAASGCEYIEMDFDNIKNDLPAAIGLIADFTEVDLDLSSAPLPTQPVTTSQTTSINAEWAQKFFNDYSLKMHQRQRLKEIMRPLSRIKRRGYRKSYFSEM
jgi:LPS sulfotransferase NodH